MSTSMYFANSLAYSSREFLAPQFDTNHATLFLLFSSISSSTVSLCNGSVMKDEEEDEVLVIGTSFVVGFEDWTNRTRKNHGRERIKTSFKHS